MGTSGGEGGFSGNIERPYDGICAWCDGRDVARGMLIASHDGRGQDVNSLVATGWTTVWPCTPCFALRYKFVFSLNACIFVDLILAGWHCWQKGTRVHQDP